MFNFVNLFRNGIFNTDQYRSDVYVELGELAEATRQKTTVSKRTWNASFEDTAKNKFGLLVFVT